MGEREDPNVERDHGDNEDPVKIVEQFKVWITILNKTSVGVEDKNTPANSQQLPINSLHKIDYQQGNKKWSKSQGQDIKLSIFEMSHLSIKLT